MPRPVWAIELVVATPEQAQEVHAYIRQFIAKQFGDDVANALQVLYGGSVKPDNVADIMQQEDVDGALVGGASLMADALVLSTIIQLKRQLKSLVKVGIIMKRLSLVIALLLFIGVTFIDAATVMSVWLRVRGVLNWIYTLIRRLKRSLTFYAMWINVFMMVLSFIV